MCDKKTRLRSKKSKTCLWRKWVVHLLLISPTIMKKFANDSFRVYGIAKKLTTIKKKQKKIFWWAFGRAYWTASAYKFSTRSSCYWWIYNVFSCKKCGKFDSFPTFCNFFVILGVAGGFVTSLLNNINKLVINALIQFFHISTLHMWFFRGSHKMHQNQKFEFFRIPAFFHLL